MNNKISFSSQVKDELCKIKINDKESIIAELFAMIIFAKNRINDKILFKTENPKILERFLKLIYKLTNKTYKNYNELKSNDKKSNGKVIYRIDINDEKDYMTIWNSINIRKLYEFCLPDMDKDIKSSFLRGAFLSSGMISDPNKEYRLEFFTTDQDLSSVLNNLLENDKNINVSVNITERNYGLVCYIKDCEFIINILTFMGASSIAMEYIQIKMLKEVRNNINRITNFETANIKKLTNASVEQINAINTIIDIKGLEFLSDELKVIANLRLKKPQLSLKDIAVLLNISKSMVNYRLKKIKEIAGKLLFDKKV